MIKKRQYAAIDIGKYVSALLVLAIHTYPFEEISPVFNTFFISTICRLAVPFFFAVSAFFFFKKYEGKDFEDTKPLFNYIRRILVLYLVWTVIYLPYTIWNYASTGFSWYNIISYLRDVVLNGSYYHLWFLPALIWGMLIVFYALKKLGAKKTGILVLVLYLVGYLINIWAPVWEKMPYVSILYGFFSKTLVTSRDGFFFAPMFLYLGYLFARGIRVKKQVSAIGLFISIVCLILEVGLYYWLKILYDTSSMFITLIPCIFFLTNTLLLMRIPYNNQYKILRTDSTVIYLSQILFARIFLILLPDAHLVVYFLTLACAQGLSAIIVRYKERVPILNYLV